MHDDRLLFDRSYSNFQWGGYSAKPRAVTDETISWLNRIDRCPAGPEVHAEVTAMSERCRAAAAAVLGGGPDEITLTENTTIGHNLVGWGLDFDPGDIIVISRHEHPANIIPWYALARRKGLEVLLLGDSRDDDELLHQLDAVLETRKVRLVSLSHISRNSGYRLPVRQAAARCRAAGAFFLVDGAQAYGAIPVDVGDIGCDAYSFCGHKWTLGPQGTGGLWLRRELLERVRPSWTGSKSQETYDLEGAVIWKATMQRHEYGTRNYALAAGWLKALELLAQWGWKAIFDRVERLVGLMKRRIASEVPEMVVTPEEWERSSGIVTLEFPGRDAAAFCDRLWSDHRILCSRLDDPARMRICVHAVNTEEECSRLTELVLEFARRKSG